MSTVSSPIELAYQNRLDSMAPAERLARSAAMFQWTRDQIARQLTKEFGEMSDELLKWKVALRLYGNEPQVRKMIEDKLADVSG
ncbi:hypothetical protein [Rubripirellula obstinata]|uniref:hypothetical protein n=1 Tax=Rubripirellula obstinata TaxID=406547 RepID=UPI00122D0560|nr:hypothetical protein [Rubripirellula obstinata]